MIAILKFFFFPPHLAENIPWSLTIYGLKKKPIHSLGIVRGVISSKKKGKNGFGYDPIFIPIKKRKTFGEMKPIQKYKMDHRFQAFKKIRKFL